jgi:manganese/zinc/iron transport system permease protein
MSPFVEITLIMILAALACSSVGVFLVLKKMAMVTDAIGHTLLLGIVVSFAIVRDLNSTWLMIGAALTGVVTVLLVEWLQKSRLIKQDAAIGLVFPVLFALGTLLASLDFRQIHLDVDAVLVGQIESKRLVRTSLFGWNLPQVGLVLTGISLLNSLTIAIFYRQLKVTTFDPDFARSLSLKPTAMKLIIVFMTSLTAVAVFDAVGPILVVAFFTIPAASARLIQNRLSTVLLTAIIISILSSLMGTSIAFEANTNLPGTIAVLMGVGYAICLAANYFLSARRLSISMPRANVSSDAA